LKEVVDYDGSQGGVSYSPETAGHVIYSSEYVGITLPDLSEYGFTQVWTSDEYGFLVSPSYSYSNEEPYESLDNVYSAEECASTCHSQYLPGGEYDQIKYTCNCYYTVECREPGILEKGRIVFAIADPTNYSKEDYSAYISDSLSAYLPPACLKSYCDYYYSKKLAYCDYPNYRKEALRNAPYNSGYGSGAVSDAPSRPDVKSYGFNYQWSTEEGFMVAKPPDYDGSGYFEPEYYVKYTMVDDIVECARICSKNGAISGEYGYKNMPKRCFCNLKNVPNNKLDLNSVHDVIYEYCTEPKIIEPNAIVFSSIPKPNYCDYSYCDIYGEARKSYCYSDMLQVREYPLKSEIIFSQNPEYSDPYKPPEHGNGGQNAAYGQEYVYGSSQEYGNKGSQEYGNGGSQEYGNGGSQEYGNGGSQEYGNQGSPEYGNQGSPEYGNQGSQDYGNGGSQDYGNGGSQDYGNQDSPEYGNQDSPEYGNQDSPENGNQDSQEYGNKGSQENGNKGSQEYGNGGSQEYGNQGSQEYGNGSSQEYGNGSSQEYGNQGSPEYGNQGSQEYVTSGSNGTYENTYPVQSPHYEDTHKAYPIDNHKYVEINNNYDHHVYDNPYTQNIPIYEDGNADEPMPHGDTGLGYNGINNGKYGEQNKTDTEETIEYVPSVLEEEKQQNKFGNVASAQAAESSASRSEHTLQICGLIGLISLLLA